MKASKAGRDADRRPVWKWAYRSDRGAD